MGLGGLAVRRSAARSRLLISTALVVALLTFLVTVMAGHFSERESASMRAQLTSGPATSAAIRVIGADSAGATAVGRVVRKAFAAQPVTTHVSWRTSTFTGHADGGPVTMIAGSEPRLPERARLVDGAWPHGATPAGRPIPVAVQAKAATKAGLEVGDTITTEQPGVSLVVAATWLPRDAHDPAWFGDPAVATGAVDEGIGPFLADTKDLAKLPAGPFPQWTVVPRADRFGSDDIEGLSASIDRVHSGIDGPDIQAALAGGLGTRLGIIDQSINAARGLVAVPAALLAVVALITITQLARLLVTARAQETHVLRARGASAPHLTRLAAAEALAISVPASAIGLIAGFIAVGRHGRPWLWPAIIVIGVVLVFAIAGCRAAFATLDQRRLESESRTALLGVTVLVVVAAAVSLWQFLQYGGSLSIDDAGRSSVDPLTVWAPALTLVALALITVLAFGPLVGALERIASRTVGLLPVLPARQVARRSGTHAMAVILTIVAVGGVGLVEGIDASWHPADERAGQLRNGADVRLSLDLSAISDSAPKVTAETFAGISGVDRAKPVIAGHASVDLDTVDMIARDGELRGFPTADTGTRVPVVVTQALADRFELRTGSTFAFSLDDNGSRGEAIVVGVSGPIAGTTLNRAFATDLSALTAHLTGKQEAPPVNQVWISTDSPDHVAALADGVSSVPVAATTRSTDSPAPYIRPAITIMRWACLGSLALALLGIIAMTATLVGTRSTEIPVLRALGLSRRQQVRSRLIELGATIAVAAVAGLLAGLAVAFATTPELVRTSLPGFPSTAGLDRHGGWGVLVAALAIFSLAVLGIGVRYARRIGREIRDADYRELSA